MNEFLIDDDKSPIDMMNDSLILDIREEPKQETKQVKKRKRKSRDSQGNKKNQGNLNTEIVVVGVGGGGNNAIKRMIESGVNVVRFVAVNTDAQDLEKFYPYEDEDEPDENGVIYRDDPNYDDDYDSPLGHYLASVLNKENSNKNGGDDVGSEDEKYLAKDIKITTVQISKDGLGAGSNPELGKEYAKTYLKYIKEALGIGETPDPNVRKPNMVFITAGMGGGTGTGASPIIAEAAKKMDILTVAVVTKPFLSLEGGDRMAVANEGIEELIKNVDSIVTVPNDHIYDLLKMTKNQDNEAGIGADDALRRANEVLMHAVMGISRIIREAAYLNIDFADVKRALKDKGYAHIGIGMGKGKNAPSQAIQAAISSPLLETSIKGAKNLLLYISAGQSLTLDDLKATMDPVNTKLDPGAKVKFGMNLDVNAKDVVTATVIITGLDINSKDDDDDELNDEEFFDENDEADNYEPNSSGDYRNSAEYREFMEFKKKKNIEKNSERRPVQPDGLKYSEPLTSKDSSKNKSRLQKEKEKLNYFDLFDGNN